MRDNGPEPIFVQIKQTLRTSIELDAQLQELLATENRLALTVTKRYVGTKYIEFVSFPTTFTEADALAAIAVLQSIAAVEQVVALSAFNLVFLSGDFAHEYAPDQPIPEAARRGLDSTTTLVNPGIVQQPHVANRLIVSWKPEYLWNSVQTGFREKILAFHAAAGCWVVQETSYSPNDLTQLLGFNGPDSQLLSKLQFYVDSGFVQYAQPDFLYSTTSQPAPKPKKVAKPKPTPRVKLPTPSRSMPMPNDSMMMSGPRVSSSER